MKQLIFIIIILITAFTFGYSQESTQIQKLLKKKNIIWVAKVQFLVNIDLLDADKAEKVKKDFKLPSRYYCRQLKMLNTADEYDYYFDERRYWASHFVDTAWTNKRTLYKTKNLKESLTLGELDTLLFRPTDCIGCNPNMDLDYDGPTRYENPIYDEEIDFIKLSACLYFDKKTSQFQILPLAIAPVLNILDDNGNFLRKQNLYWLPVDELQRPVDWNSPQINWGVRTASDLVLEELEVVKYTQKEPFKTQLIQSIQKSKAPLKGSIQEPIYLHKQKDSFYLSYATKLSFENPEDYTIYPKILVPQNIEKIRLVLDWTWDTQKQRFSTTCKGFLPIARTYYDQDKYNFSPIFYRQY